MRQEARRLESGHWILTRTDATTDSERDISRDDVLFQSLAQLFVGEKIQFDLKEIAVHHDVTPEEVFAKIHGFYGYMCLGTGENPAFNETLTPDQKKQREQAIERALTEAKLPHVLIKGKYMGVNENTYFIPFNNQTIGLSAVLQSDSVKQVADIATKHNQDSLLICQKGYACYLYTFGTQKGSVITGKTAVIYPDERQLPDDCYSLFLNHQGEGVIGFTCGFNFGRIYSTIQEYVDSENKTLQEQYNSFLTRPLVLNSIGRPSKKIVILLRGTDGYNQYAMDLQNQLKTSGVKIAIFGTDANIAKVNEEVSQDNTSNPRGPKAGWEWPQIRSEFIRRNQEIYLSLLRSNEVDVIVYADMNKLFEFMQPMITQAQMNGHIVLSHVVNSFVFEHNRSDYVKKLCDQYGPYMGRHVQDFNHQERSQISANTILGNVEQLHSLSVDKFAGLIVERLHQLNQQESRDQASTSVLTSGTGTAALFAAQQQHPAVVSSEEKPALI